MIVKNLLALIAAATTALLLAGCSSADTEDSINAFAQVADEAPIISAEFATGGVAQRLPTCSTSI